MKPLLNGMFARFSAAQAQLDGSERREGLLCVFYDCSSILEP